MAEPREAWAKLGELAGVVGSMDAVLRGDPDRYEPVAEGWGQRLDMIVAFADSQIQEIIDFGEGYDA